jgi:hypothetical protein
MSFLSSIRNRVSSAVNTVRQYQPTVSRVISGATTAKKVFDQGKSAFESASTLASRGYRAASQAVADNRQMRVYNGGRPPSAFQRLTGPLGVVTNAAKTVRGIGTAISDVRNAIRTGSRADIATAAQSTLGTVRSGLSTVQSGFQAWGARQAMNTYRAATDAFRAAAPTVAANVAEAAGRAATRTATMAATGATALGATTRQVARAGAREAAEAAARAAGPLARAVSGSGTRAAARAAINAGSNAAVRAATTTAARAAASTVGRAAARFAPGVNVAMAAVDTGIAVATLADPNASTGRKVTSVITAAGSIAAATNIPIVSQVGAGISAVSSFVGSFF